MSAPHDGVPADIEALFDQIGDWEWLRLDSAFAVAWHSPYTGGFSPGT